MNNILIVGCGHMGSALLNFWIKNKKYKFTIIDPFKHKLLKNKFNHKNITITNSVKKINTIKDFDIVIIAVTPQVAEKTLKDYKYLSFKKTCVLVSIMAGKKIIFLNKLLPNIKQIVRVMPNMPALIGEGVSCLVSNKFVTKINKNKITNLFNQVGTIVWFNKEKDIDIATAISGSGPGYIFYLIDAMENGANNLGLNDKINKKIILETFKGSLKLLEHTGIKASQLANKIAIKGGTTEAGIQTMKNNKVDKILSNTFLSAYKRANILGKK